LFFTVRGKRYNHCGCHHAEFGGGRIVRAVVCELPFHCAEMFAMVRVGTVPVLTLNVAVEAPAEIVMEAGTTADALLEPTVTAIPDEGATPFRVTVTATVPPPCTVVGFNEID
jgi:hypothetical protein